MLAIKSQIECGWLPHIFYGSCGGGGLLRDSAGRLVFGFASSFGHKTIMEAEIMALINGVKLCLDHGCTILLIESDSQTLLSIGLKWQLLLLAFGCSYLTNSTSSCSSSIQP
ncbi:hypothetical protein ACH5RR_029505 [Cinchona calisaya]|uniref:RNase H type-1 domain-containing protein n=1 Tax=Cinchona calisaya TaxID=153742 RepID=A0ABD2YRU5_9GENT